MRFLLTRPTPEAERTAQALRALGHEAEFAPMLEIENLPAVPLGTGPFAAVLMTSGNAARALAEHPDREALLHLRCFAVGGQTAEASRTIGFADVASAGGDGGDLARLVAQEIGTTPLPLLYLAGNDRARDMAGDLAPAGLTVETVVVYRANAAQQLAPQIAAALRDGGFDAVMHYSRRTTFAFVDCVRRSGLAEAAARPVHLTISARASEPLAQIGAGRILVADHPDEQAMLDLIARI